MRVKRLRQGTSGGVRLARGDGPARPGLCSARSAIPGPVAANKDGMAVGKGAVLQGKREGMGERHAAAGVINSWFA